MHDLMDGSSISVVSRCSFGKAVATLSVRPKESRRRLVVAYRGGLRIDNCGCY